MSLLLDGKKVRDEKAARLKDEIRHLKTVPTLAIIQIGDNPSSNAYMKAKQSFGQSIGVKVQIMKFDENSETDELVTHLSKLSFDDSITGIIIQMPLPGKFKALSEVLFDAIPDKKDVDALGFRSKARIINGTSIFYPATAKGIVSLLEFYGINMAGKEVVVVGRSLLVGLPTAILTLALDATVTICHSKTKNLNAIAKRADILITAAGQPGLIGKEAVHKDQVVVDVGITRSGDASIGEKLIGDVAYDEVFPIVRAISPVHGGVGPMTVASLFENLLTAYREQEKLTVSGES